MDVEDEVNEIILKFAPEGIEYEEEGEEEAP